MKIALLAHSHHKVTGSSDFLANLLRKLGTVETFFDESWMQRQAEWVAHFEPREFDCIVIFQAHECFQYINRDHPNVVFVPMYDAMIWNGTFYWNERFNSAKTLCFSSALYREVTARSATSAYFQYYPDPEQYPRVQDYSVPRGYYWRRRNEINDETIQRLCKGFQFEHFTLHNVPDPNSGINDTARGPRVDALDYTVTGWHASEESHLNSVSKHNIYFAPRLCEGIGFGFLKAMSMGLCVVAPDTPTHDEYIAQMCTGILYRPHKPGAVDLRPYREIGSRARESIERGRRRWDSKSEEFLEFFATPNAVFQRQRFAVDSWIETSHKAALMRKGTNPPEFSSVAVVTVCLNAREEIEKTIRSVAAQDYPGLEYVIFDGGSTDGTVDVIRQYERALAFWTSRPDAGVYQAMQQALSKVKSDWVLFMNAGDFFVSADALRRLFAGVPHTADVVYGHQVYRATSGIDEVRIAADFAWTWSRLQAGEYDLACLAGFPGHQATAVRTQLLRDLEFDPLFRIAADHDLLWRAWRRGAKFFHADEIISVYLGGGFSARQFERCKQEWCVIAFRHGPRKAALRLRKSAQADLGEAIQLEYGGRGERFARRFSMTVAGRMLGHLLGPEVLVKTAVTAYVSAANAIYLQLPARRPQSEAASAAKSVATPEKSVQFTQADIPTFLSEARGLAEPEKWGAWSQGESVELIFQEQLPDSFTLILHACAFGPNANASIPVTVGKITRQMRMKGRRRRKYKLDFSGHAGDRTITFSIPYPMAPAELTQGASTDRRQLGLGFVRMHIQPNPATPLAYHRSNADS